MRSVRNQLIGIVAWNGLSFLCVQPKFVKIWKREFWDGVFMDQNFFYCDPATFSTLCLQMKNFLLTETDKIPDILSTFIFTRLNDRCIDKIPPSGSSNLFLSREMEAINRALMIRRLSFIILNAEMDIVKQNIPDIHEKVVDILRLGPGISTAEVNRPCFQSMHIA